MKRMPVTYDDKNWNTCPPSNSYTCFDHLMIDRSHSHSHHMLKSHWLMKKFQKCMNRNDSSVDHYCIYLLDIINKMNPLLMVDIDHNRSYSNQLNLYYYQNYLHYSEHIVVVVANY